ncbi:MAG: hypothetical protein GF308_13545 [Candidatus Heimdallarchaeota archaeon]|nr:hypothetical protein [Candidatus Heimdallarchaeota archaeon]
MGKAVVIIFAVITFLLVPISIFYLADTSGTDPVFTLELQGRVYDAKFGELGEKGFGFFKWLTGDGIIFAPTSWNDAFTDNTVIGLPAGTAMSILWYVSLGLILLGIIIAFWKTRLSGIFFILAAIADGLQSLVWYLAMALEYEGQDYLFFPIPISALFLLIVAIIAFTTKKKESYYFSPGYSYGYGRR